jgi:hypothetical protein
MTPVVPVGGSAIDLDFRPSPPPRAAVPPPFPGGAGRPGSRGLGAPPAAPCAAVLARFAPWAPLSRLVLVGAKGLEP